MMLRLLPLLSALLILAITMPVQAEQTATVLRDTELRSEPYSDASITTTLDGNTALTILKRHGGWYQVQHGDRKGWVRMSAIRPGGPSQTDGSDGIAETLRLLDSGRSGSSGVTVATGIRGLDAADMANATPDHKALEKLNRFQISAEQARAFAAEAELKSRKLAYIEAAQGTGTGED